MKDDDILFETTIKTMYEKSYQSVRIAGGFGNLNYSININKINWFFLGGIFGGHKDSLLKFVTIMKELCIDLITSKNTITWEVVLWSIIFQNNPELFDRYIADHNVTMLRDY